MVAERDRLLTMPATCTEGCAGVPAPMADASAPHLRRWAWWLTALTMGWNSLEAVVAIISGLIAGSIALVGFGLDSIVEVSSAWKSGALCDC